MSKMLPILVTAAMISSPVTVALAQGQKSEPDVRERAEEAMREGAESIMRALELMMRAVPQYDMPEVLDNGDIIIRRRHPPPEGQPERSTKPKKQDETAT